MASHNLLKITLYYERTNNQKSLYLFFIDGYLKVMPATFLLGSLVCLKERTCETKKNVFYFIWKALFVLDIIKF